MAKIRKISFKLIDRNLMHRHNFGDHCFGGPKGNTNDEKTFMIF